MSKKIVEVEIGKIVFDPATISGSDHRWGEISQRLGDDVYSALTSDHAIRVREKDGKYFLVSGHAIFRLVRARHGGGEKITVKVCGEDDEIDADIYEAASLLIVPALLGQRDSEILSSVTRLKNHTGVGRLGRDLYKTSTWRQILDPKLDRTQPVKQAPSADAPVKKPDAVSAAPARKRGRPKKVAADVIENPPSGVSDAMPIGDIQEDPSAVITQMSDEEVQPIRSERDPEAESGPIS